MGCVTAVLRPWTNSAGVNRHWARVGRQRAWHSVESADIRIAPSSITAILTSSKARDWVIYDAHVNGDVCGDVDIKIILRDDGIIRIESAWLFAKADGL